MRLSVSGRDQDIRIVLPALPASLNDTVIPPFRAWNDKQTSNRDHDIGCGDRKCEAE